MTAVELRVHADFSGEDDLKRGTTVVGNIYPTDRRGGGRRDILIPVGADVTPESFSVEAGRYLIEALMPSGVILSREVTVTEGQTIPVDLDAGDSPSASHAWQHLVGNVESGATYKGPRPAAPTPRSLGSRVLTRREIITGEVAVDPDEEISQPPRVWWIPDSREEGWDIENLNRLAARSPTADVRAVEELVSERPLLLLPQAAYSDSQSHLYRFDERGPVDAGEAVDRGARQFAVVELGGDAFLVTLPVPWRDTRMTEVQVEVMVTARQNPSGSPVAVAVRDVVLGPALAYMGNGALSVAATMFDNVERMLYEKVMNQFAAAAAAYVLIGTDVSSERRAWYSWVRHLSQWFGWLPDGAILWGTLQLRTATSTAEIAVAKGTLLQAAARGVPVYTLGLRWLIDGLSEFEDDPECERRLKQVRELSWRVDTRQPFVVLRLNSRAR